MSSPAGFAFKKRFGQHFLRDTGTIDRIVRLIDPAPDDVVLEVGAGDGALSIRLVPRVSRLLAVERDLDCVPFLEQALSPYPAATIIPEDILEIDIRALILPLAGSGRVRVTGNLPYNIATAIIGRLLDLRLPIADMIFMVQLEVARRITAAPGTRDYGLLSVRCQHCAEVRLQFAVSPACFVPRPRVTSAMVTFRPQDRGWDWSFETRFQEVLRAAFAHRRKTLANSLARHPLTASVAESMLRRAGISGARRAEQLSVPEFERLALASFPPSDSDNSHGL